MQHKDKRVISTKDFGKFNVYIIEKIDCLLHALKREKYWKSCAGRKKLKILFNKI